MAVPVDPAPFFTAFVLLVSALASIFSAALLVFSVFLARRQIREALHMQRRATASQLWDAYLAHALRYPMFAYPKHFLDKFDFEQRRFNNSEEEFERYEWFFSILLRATDETLIE